MVSGLPFAHALRCQKLASILKNPNGSHFRMACFFRICTLLCLSNRKRFPCLHSLIYTPEGLEELLSRILPTPRVFIAGYANTGKKFYIAFIK